MGVAHYTPWGPTQLPDPDPSYPVSGIAAAIKAGDASLGGITREDAERRMDAIADGGRDDAEAMEAYDTLYRFVTLGRPW